MSYLLFPGRHLVNTRFQESCLRRLLSTKPNAMPGIIKGTGSLNQAPAEIIFAITSANQESSRFNPIPFHVRTFGVDRFAEAQAALPGTRLNETGDALERVFLGLDMQRMFLKRNQQIQEWSYS